MPSDKPRNERLNVSLMPEAMDDIRRVAEANGVAPNAWAAMVLTSTARKSLGVEQALLEAAKKEVRSLIGQQDVLPLLLAATREMEEGADEES